MGQKDEGVRLREVTFTTEVVGNVYVPARPETCGHVRSGGARRLSGYLDSGG